MRYDRDYHHHRHYHLTIIIIIIITIITTIIIIISYIVGNKLEGYSRNSLKEELASVMKDKIGRVG